MSSATVTDVLDRLDLATRELHAAARAALECARTMARERDAAVAEDDEWKRMPGAKERCSISNWSRSSLNRHIAAGRVRRKTSTGSVFYSGADVRKLIASSDS